MHARHPPQPRRSLRPRRRGDRDVLRGGARLPHADLVPGQAAFFQAPGSTNDHDLGDFQIGSGAGPSTAGRHRRLTTSPGRSTRWPSSSASRRAGRAGRLVGASDHVTTKALYAHDPDGLEFEVCWLVPADLITDDVVEGKTGAGRSTSTPRSPATAPTPAAASACRSPSLVRSTCSPCASTKVSCSSRTHGRTRASTTSARTASCTCCDPHRTVCSCSSRPATWRPPRRCSTASSATWTCRRRDESLATVGHMFEAALYIGRLSQEVSQRHRTLRRVGADGTATFILGGQIGRRHPTSCWCTPRATTSAPRTTGRSCRSARRKYGKFMLDLAVKTHVGLATRPRSPWDR